MKQVKDTLLWMVIFLVTLLFSNVSFGQNANIYTYKPKEDAVKVFVKALKAKTPEKQAELLMESISIDSNFSHPYCVMGDLKVQERQVFENQGAFYYYTKCIDKQTKYNCGSVQGIEGIENSNPMADYFSYCNDPRGGIIFTKKIESKEYVQKKRIEAVYYALIWNENKIDQGIEKLISASTKDIQTMGKAERLLECAQFKIETAEKICLSLGDYYLQHQMYQEALQQYQILEDFDNLQKYDTQKLKKEVKESLQNRIALAYALNGQKELAIQKLTTNLKTYNPEKNTFIEAVKVINILDKLQSAETCKNSKGEMVYCDNKNIRVDNLSSAIQIMSAYKEYDLNSMNKLIYKNSNYMYGLPIGGIEELFKWTALGSDIGIIWPKPRKTSVNEILKSAGSGDQSLDARNIIPYFLFDFFFKCNCVPEGILDLRSSATGYDLYVASKRQANITGIISIPLDWRQFNNMPLKCYNSNGEVVLKDSLGNNFPTTVACSKAYEVYKANYEAQLARQEAERMEQERMRVAQEQARIQQENETKLQLAIAEAEAKKATQQQQQKVTQAQTKAAVDQGKVVDPFAFLELLNAPFSSSKSSVPKKLVQCPVCKGVNAQHTCPQCRGKGSYMCNKCNGRGEYTGQKPCNICLGKGIINCEKCNATGVENCWTCRGTGKVEQ
jgi:hypothetical protein